MVEINATVDAEFQCPECDRAVTIATADDGTQSVLHALPMCLKFLHLQADDYLVWVHAKLKAESA